MKGQKTGGRIAGTPNRLQSEAKESIKSIVNDYLETKVFEDLENVDAATRLNVMVKLSSYIVPKERDVNLNDQRSNRPQTVMEKKFAAMTIEEKKEVLRESLKRMENAE
jgi:hypothetical protein